MNQPEELNPEFEQQLTHALRHVDPPAGFADRILARAESPARAEAPAEPAAPARAKVVTMTPRHRIWTSGALAATLLVAAILTQQTHERHERQKAEAAQQQFDAAMRITDQTLEHVRQQLQQAGVQIGN